MANKREIFHKTKDASLFGTDPLSAALRLSVSAGCDDEHDPDLDRPGDGGGGPDSETDPDRGGGGGGGPDHEEDGGVND